MDADDARARVKKPCRACGRTCAGHARYKKRGEDGYWHRACPRASDAPDADDTAGPTTSGDDARGGETSDGYVTSPTVGSGRRRTTRRAGRTEKLQLESAARAFRAAATPTTARTATAMDEDVSRFAKRVDGWYRAVTRVELDAPWVRRALAASSAVYVAGAWLYVLPSSLRMAANAVLFVLQIITVSAILAGTFVVAGLVSRRDLNRDGFSRRLLELRRNAVDLARGIATRESDFNARTPPVKTPNRFIETATVELAETPRRSPAPTPTASPFRGDEEIRRLAEEKRQAETMLSEASETIEFLRDALQSVDEARASDRRRLVELERKLAKDSHTVKALSKRVRSKEIDLAAAEPWMLDP